MASSTDAQFAQIQTDIKWIRASLDSLAAKIDRRGEECEDRLKCCEARFGSIELRQGISTAKLAALVGGVSLIASGLLTLLVGAVKQLLKVS